jgi:hypothetical protein
LFLQFSLSVLLNAEEAEHRIPFHQARGKPRFFQIADAEQESEIAQAPADEYAE